MNRKHFLQGVRGHLLLIPGAIVMAVPFLWMVLTSFKGAAEIMMIPPKIFPETVRWENYGTVIGTLSFGRYYLNSAIVTLVRTLGQLIFCSMAAFAFAKLRFPGKRGLFILFLSVLMVPAQMCFIPNFITMRFFGLLDTLTAVILPGAFSAFGLFLMRQFFMKLPDELMDSGTVDGCSYYQILWKIYFPLTKSALTALAIFTIMYSWNDLLWPLIVTFSREIRVLSVGIALLQGQYTIPYNEMMAGAVMATAPMLILFIFLQQYFIQGIAMTGLKG